MATSADDKFLDDFVAGMEDEELLTFLECFDVLLERAELVRFVKLGDIITLVGEGEMFCFNPAGQPIQPLLN